MPSLVNRTSVVWSGLMVRMVLPGRPPPPEETQQPGALASEAGHGERIVLAEDDDHVRAILTSTLRSAGYNVSQAADGIECMKRFQRHRNTVRLVVLDLDLPRKSGRSCLQDIRRADPDLPVIVITASG